VLRVLRRPLVPVLACLAVIAALAFVVRGHNAVTRFDANVVSDVADHRTTAIVDAARAITNLGAGVTLTVTLAVLCVGLLALRVLPLRAAIAPLLSLEVGVLLVPLAKSIVDRPRPPAALHEVVEHSSGFPSGHSTQAAAGWLALGLALAVAGRWPGRSGRRGAPLAACALVVLLVGISRVVLSVHSPTDVLAGWLLGTAVAVVVVALLVPTRSTA
jgi:membrane-associated phospholipid phosphatase